jgi:ABC-type multidrug transport system fused ATPase/permease subunit
MVMKKMKISSEIKDDIEIYVALLLLLVGSLVVLFYSSWYVSYLIFSVALILFLILLDLWDKKGGNL